MTGHLALEKWLRACVLVRASVVLEAGSGPMFARPEAAQTARTWALVMRMIRWHAALACLGLGWQGSGGAWPQERAIGESIIAVIYWVTLYSRFERRLMFVYV